MRVDEKRVATYFRTIVTRLQICASTKSVLAPERHATAIGHDCKNVLLGYFASVFLGTA